LKSGYTLIRSYGVRMLYLQRPKNAILTPKLYTARSQFESCSGSRWGLEPPNQAPIR